MLVKSQPPGVGFGGHGGTGGFSEAAGLEPGHCLSAGYQHQPGRFAELGHRQRRGCLTVHSLEVFQARIDTQQDQRDSSVPIVGELRPLLNSARREGRAHGLVELADQPVLK